MAFDFSTLVTDRTQADVAYAKALLNKLVDGTATEEERAEWNSFTLKGTYNHTDLNRVTAALEALKSRLESYGYAIADYQALKVPHVKPESVTPDAPSVQLPDGYIQLEYIESTGTQYVDTVFKPTTENMRVVCDVAYTASPNGVCLYGAQTASTTFPITVGADGNNPTFFVGSSLRLLTQTMNVNTRYVLDAHAKNGTLTVSLDDVTSTANYSGSLAKTLNLALFGNNNNGTTTTCSSARLYSCQIYDNETLVRDFVPCVSPTGDVGLFDVVTQQFYGNAGTGLFIAGNRVGVVLPDGYTKLTHIESTGTQYINTGFKPNNNTRVVMDAQATATGTYVYWGARTGSLSKTFCCFVFATSVRSDYGTTQKNISTSNTTSRVIVEQNKNVCTHGELSVSHDAQTFQCDFPLYLLAANTNGSAEYASMPAKVYSCRIYDNGTLIRYYVPCINPSGDAGLFDVVNQQFYGNAGTGVFTPGSRTDVVLPDAYKRLAYIESNGTQYIDTGVPNVLTSKFVLRSTIAFTNTTGTQIMGFSGNAGYGIGVASGNWWDMSGASVTATANAKCNIALTMQGSTFSKRVDSTIVTGSRVEYSQVKNVLLCAAWDTMNSTVVSYYLHCRLYDTQVFVDDSLVRDFIPCVNDLGQVGMFDLVSQQFFGNSGTGAFIAGALPRTLPSGYTQVEYIQSSGTQYINTGFKPNNNTRVVMDAELIGTGSVSLFGARNSATLKNYAILSLSTYIRSDYNTAYSQQFAVNVNTHRVYDKNKETTTVDGTSQSYTNSTFQADNNMFLLATNENGTARFQSSARLYSCQVYDNGTLIRDFVPCTNASSSIGLYDLVNHTFYTNAGSDTFTAGATVDAQETVVVSTSIVASTYVVSRSNDTEYDDYVWYEFDWPTQESMQRYLRNISAIRNVLELPTETPQTPKTMSTLSISEANDIEQILVVVEMIINSVVSGFKRNNAFTFWSGYQPLPSAVSDLGRTWAELDMMNTTWENWQLATWYLLLYGNLRAKGVIE